MSNCDKTVLIFINHYLPGTKFGGPIQSISNIVDWLGEEYKFKIITSDRDFLSDTSYQNVKLNNWNQVGKAQVYYISPNNLNIMTFKKLLESTSYDVLYFNSFFSPYFTLLPLLLIKILPNKTPGKILLAPRGELAKGALEQKKAKKKIFLKIAKWMGLFKKINWHATNEIEKEDIYRELGEDGKEVFISSNLPPMNPKVFEGKSNKEEGNLRMIYLSRITPKKNIIYLFDILKSLEKIEVKFDLFGTIDDQRYWKHCKKKIDQLPPNIQVSHFGHLDHSEVLDTISNYDLFVLPTKSENFGHAIVESMSAGTPVLISTNTPWSNLNEKKVGWDYSLDNPLQFKEKIIELASLGAEEMNKIKREVKENYGKVVEEGRVKETRKMFKKIIVINDKKD
jgi:glycosyltransferase involved in cell wall biosynthesis